MRLRKFLSLTVLTAALLFTLLTGSPARARECPFDYCVGLYNDCVAMCNGSRPCERTCRNDYSACQCANCGLCPINPPQARPDRR